MNAKKVDVLQPVDAVARRLAKSLTRTARFAALGTIDAGLGAPSVSRVAIATFPTGEIGFFISALAAHFTNLTTDPRCSLLVGNPGKGDPLAHPRVTLIGTAAPLPDGSEKENFRFRFRSKNAKSKLYQDLPDFSYWKFTPLKASLNGGFGRAFAPSPTDLMTAVPDIEQWRNIESSVIEHMNSDHASAVDMYAKLAGAHDSGWRMTGIDPEGLDLINNDASLRLWFEAPLTSSAEIRQRLVALAKT